jgi:hypothetical protein
VNIDQGGACSRPAEMDWWPGAGSIAMKITYLVLSALDCLLSIKILSATSSNALDLEANPIAAHVYRVAGWLGLLAYKAILVGLVLFLARVVAATRPRTASRLLMVGCVATAVVVLFGIYMAARLTA